MLWKNSNKLAGGTMSLLAILLMLLGVVLTFAFGAPGIIVGPALAIAGILLFRQERNRRRAAVAAPDGPTGPAIPKRPTWQRFLIVVGCIAIVIGGLIAIVFRMTAGLVGAADGFFAAMKAHDLNRAKTYLAEDFRASTTDSELEQFIQRSALAHYSSSSWLTRKVENNRGYLEGTISTDTGGAIPLKVSGIRERGEWKIYSISKPDAGLTSAEPRQMPSAADQARLIKASTHSLADAVARKDFHAFYATVGGLWQKQMTPEQFQAAFQSLIDSGGNFLVLDQLDPAIVRSGFDANGILEVTARYATTPKALTVEDRYLYEGLDWKLVGLEVTTQ